MFWLFIPAIYFYIGPCMGLMQNLAAPRMRAMFTAWSLVVGNVFNLIIAPQGVGFLSDWFAGSRGADAASLRLALLVLATDGILGGVSFLHGGPDHHCRSKARHRPCNHSRRSAGMNENSFQIGPWPFRSAPPSCCAAPP